MPKTVEVGVCKYCGSENLEYGTYEMTADNMLTYNYHCGDCKESDSDWYSLTYEGKDE